MFIHNFVSQFALVQWLYTKSRLIKKVKRIRSVEKSLTLNFRPVLASKNWKINYIFRYLRNDLSNIKSPETQIVKHKKLNKWLVLVLAASFKNKILHSYFASSRKKPSLRSRKLRDKFFSWQLGTLSSSCVFRLRVDHFWQLNSSSFAKPHSKFYCYENEGNMTLWNICLFILIYLQSHYQSQNTAAGRGIL